MPGKIDTAEGRLTAQLPQVRATSEAYPAELWQAIKGRTDLLERRVVELYVRGPVDA